MSQGSCDECPANSINYQCQDCHKVVNEWCDNHCVAKHKQLCDGNRSPGERRCVYCNEQRVVQTCATCRKMFNLYCASHEGRHGNWCPGPPQEDREFLQLIETNRKLAKDHQLSETNTAIWIGLVLLHQGYPSHARRLLIGRHPLGEALATFRAGYPVKQVLEILKTFQCTHPQTEVVKERVTLFIATGNTRVPLTYWEERSSPREGPLTSWKENKHCRGFLPVCKTAMNATEMSSMIPTSHHICEAWRCWVDVDRFALECSEPLRTHYRQLAAAEIWILEQMLNWSITKRESPIPDHFVLGLPDGCGGKLQHDILNEITMGCVNANPATMATNPSTTNASVTNASVTTTTITKPVVVDVPPTVPSFALDFDGNEFNFPVPQIPQDDDSCDEADDDEMPELENAKDSKERDEKSKNDSKTSVCPSAPESTQPMLAKSTRSVDNSVNGSVGLVPDSRATGSSSGRLSVPLTSTDKPQPLTRQENLQELKLAREAFRMQQWCKSLDHFFECSSSVWIDADTIAVDYALTHVLNQNFQTGHHFESLDLVVQRFKHSKRQRERKYWMTRMMDVRKTIEETIRLEFWSIYQVRLWARTFGDLARTRWMMRANLDGHSLKTRLSLYPVSHDPKAVQHKAFFRFHVCRVLDYAVNRSVVFPTASASTQPAVPQPVMNPSIERPVGAFARTKPADGEIKQFPMISPLMMRFRLVVDELKSKLKAKT